MDEARLIDLLKMLVEFNMAMAVEAQQRESALISKGLTLITPFLRGFLEGRGLHSAGSAPADLIVDLFQSLSVAQTAAIMPLLSFDQKMQLAEWLDRAGKSKLGASAEASKSASTETSDGVAEASKAAAEAVSSVEAASVVAPVSL